LLHCNSAVGMMQNSSSSVNEYKTTTKAPEG